MRRKEGIEGGSEGRRNIGSARKEGGSLSALTGGGGRKNCW